MSQIFSAKHCDAKHNTFKNCCDYPYEMLEIIYFLAVLM